MFEGDLGFSEEGLPPGWDIQLLVFGPHCSTESIFGLRIPVSTIQFDKYRGIWNSHFCLDREHSKDFAHPIKSGDDLFVQQGLNFISTQKIAELFPV